jgi:hypothetical protein
MVMTLAQIDRRLAAHGIVIPRSKNSRASRRRSALMAFQSRQTDISGRPLRVDGRPGPATAWALAQEPGSASPITDDAFSRVPGTEAGGTVRGREALSVAVAERAARKGEQGGQNRGPDMRKYLNGYAEEGSSWCAAFVSWCFHQNAADIAARQFPFPYNVSAQSLFNSIPKGDRFKRDSGVNPEPGDLICWGALPGQQSWQGHIGIVHSYEGGVVFTIEGNRTQRVDGFKYPIMSLIGNFRGFARVR